MADCYRRFCCCVNCPQIHPARPPAQNVIDSHKTRNQAAIAISNDLMFSSVQTTSVPLKSSSAIKSCNDQNSMITTLHAAAVNGDKTLLRKLLNGGGSEVDVVDRFDRTPLMYSVLGDRPVCAELLLKRGADIDRKDIIGRTALHWAAHKGNVNCVRILLAHGANWKEKDTDGQTAVHLCTRHKSDKCLSLLLKNIDPGAVDGQDTNKRTALHLAALSGNLEQVQILIKQGSNIAIPDIEGKTPLHWAAGRKDPEAVSCVKLILETSPNVVNWQDYEGCTALHLAVADDNEAVVAALLSIETCNVNALDNMFRTPLHWAAVLGFSNIVRMLFDGKADYASSDSNGATPLHYAALNDFAETVEVFLSRTSVKDEPDNEGRTALLWAAGNGANAAISCFIQHGVDLLQMDKTGATAMHIAAAAGHASSVHLLLQAGGTALVETTDLSKRTPLSRACEMGRASVVETLIDNGAKVTDVKDQDGQSLLHWAAFGGHANVCQMLVKYGIDPNICDLAGRTPLHCAAYRGNVNCMSVLLENKADCNVQDAEGATSLHFACSKGYIDAIKLLVQYNALINNMEFTEDRYTPLDYALMGEHFEVAQYMIEHGAVSITGIQDIAALKIQAWFRGYRVRKTFVERKKLLMKHEQLRKDAAKKKATERRHEPIKDSSTDQRGLDDKFSLDLKSIDAESAVACRNHEHLADASFNSKRTESCYHDSEVEHMST